MQCSDPFIVVKLLLTEEIKNNNNHIRKMFGCITVEKCVMKITSKNALKDVLSMFWWLKCNLNLLMRFTQTVANNSGRRLSLNIHL